MAGLWTPDQADQLLAAGVITPEQHQHNSQMQPQAAPSNADPFAAGAAAAGYAPKAPISDHAQAASQDPFAAGAAAAGISPPDNKVYNAGFFEPGAPKVGIVNGQAISLPAASVAQHAPASGPPRANGLPPNVTVEGSMTIIPKSQRAAEGEAAKASVATPSTAKKSSAQAAADPGPSVDDVRAIEGKPPLTPRMRRDKEFARRVDERAEEHAPVDQAEADVVAAEKRKLDTAVKQATDEYQTKAMGNAIVEGMRLRDEQQRAKDLEEQKRYLEGLDNEAKALANTRLDAGRLYRNQSTGDMILGGIMRFFGAAATGRSTGNAFVQSVNRNIAQDLELQKADLENKKAILTQRRGIYGDMLKLYGDKEAARLAAQAHMKESVANRYDEVAARYAPDKKQAEGDAAAAALRKQAEEDRFKANEMIWNQLQQQRAAAAAAQAAAAKEASNRRWELLKENNKQAYEALQTAQKEGTAPPPWALRALSLTPDDAPKAGPDGAMTKEERVKQREAQHEVEGSVAEVDRYLADPGKTTGAGASRLDVTMVRTGVSTDGQIKRVNDMDQYNAFAERVAGQIYRLQTGNAEPKNAETIEKYARPYHIGPNDGPQARQQKLEKLRADLISAGRGKKVLILDEEGAAPKANKDAKDPYSQYRTK